MILQAAKEAILFNGFEKQILDAKEAAKKALADAAAAEKIKTKSEDKEKTSQSSLNDADDAKISRTRFASISYEDHDPATSEIQEVNPDSDSTPKDNNKSPSSASSSSPEEAEKKLQSKSDISGEIAVLKEIKDIRDELNILNRILEEQKSIADKLFNPLNKLRMNPGVQEYYAETSGLERRIQDVKKMDRDAERTYLHVCCFFLRVWA